MPFRGTFPAAKLTPAPFGLFSVADVQRHSGADEHWVGRFDQESEACTFDATLLDICGDGSPIEIFNTSDQPRFFEVAPFGIIARDTCVSTGWSVVDRRARVVRQLDLITPKAVEVELWNGFYHQAHEGDEQGMYLSSTSGEVVTTGAQKVKIGLALLEQALAGCSSGFQGVIHMSPLIAAMVGMEMQRDGDQLFTNNGNLVVVGTGYDGRGPGDNSAPSSNFVHWMYATGPVFVHLGTNELVTINENVAVDPRTNEATYVAERPASVHWDGCCHFGVQVDIRL